MGGGGGDVVEKTLVAGGEAEHVAIDGGVGEVEGKGGDGGGSVVAHPFQPADVVVVGGENSVEVADDGLGGGVHIAGAAVVAEALPHLQHLFFVGFGQRFDSGKVTDEIVIIRHSLYHAGLLEDDFGNPDFVRVVGMAPRQIAAVFIEPIQQDF